MEDNFTIKDAITVFMLPFSFDDEYYRSLRNGSIWEISKLGIDKSAFYPHIYDFLVDNLSVTDCEKQNPNKCIVFSLRDGLETKRERFFTKLLNGIAKLFNENLTCPSIYSLEESKCITKLFSKIDFQIKIKGNETDKDKINFRFLNEKSKLSSPKLILYPQSNVGILIMSIELNEKKCTLNDLLIFNNMLHKIDQPPEIKITLPENAHEKRVEEANKIYKVLNVKEEGKENELSPNPQSWYLYDLFKFLLKNKYKIKPFNNSRFHLCTYLLIDSSEKFEDGKQLNKKGLMMDLIRLARCQNKKYKVLSDALKDNKENSKMYLQTFENIYIASSVEGVCMMVDSQDNNNTFFTNFKDATFLARYLWIYLLVCLQRYTLIELTKRLMKINLEKELDSKESLKLSQMKMNSFFTDISDHTQHNVFYQFCVDKLLVRKHLEDVTEKIEDVDFILRDKRSRSLQYVLHILLLPAIFFALVTFYQIDTSYWLIKLIPIVFICFIVRLLWLIGADTYRSSRFWQRTKKK